MAGFATATLTEATLLAAVPGLAQYRVPERADFSLERAEAFQVLREYVFARGLDPDTVTVDGTVEPYLERVHLYRTAALIFENSTAGNREEAHKEAERYSRRADALLAALRFGTDADGNGVIDRSESLALSREVLR